MTYNPRIIGKVFHVCYSVSQEVTYDRSQVKAFVNLWDSASSVHDDDDPRLALPPQSQSAGDYSQSGHSFWPLIPCSLMVSESGDAGSHGGYGHFSLAMADRASVSIVAVGCGRGQLDRPDFMGRCGGLLANSALPLHFQSCRRRSPARIRVAGHSGLSALPQHTNPHTTLNVSPFLQILTTTPYESFVKPGNRRHVRPILPG